MSKDEQNRSIHQVVAKQSLNSLTQVSCLNFAQEVGPLMEKKIMGEISLRHIRCLFKVYRDEIKNKIWMLP